MTGKAHAPWGESVTHLEVMTAGGDPIQPVS
jgi:hypothetical protein